MSMCGICWYGAHPEAGGIWIRDHCGSCSCCLPTPNSVTLTLDEVRVLYAFLITKELTEDADNVIAKLEATLE